MAAIECEASGCNSTDRGGKVFFQCGNCKRWWCSEHGRQGKECPGCRRGYLHR